MRRERADPATRLIRTTLPTRLLTRVDVEAIGAFGHQFAHQRKHPGPGAVRNRRARPARRERGTRRRLRTRARTWSADASAARGAKATSDAPISSWRRSTLCCARRRDSGHEDAEVEYDGNESHKRQRERETAVRARSHLASQDRLRDAAQSRRGGARDCVDGGLCATLRCPSAARRAASVRSGRSRPRWDRGSSRRALSQDGIAVLWFDAR